MKIIMQKKVGPIPVWLLLCLFALSHTTETICTAALPIIADSLGVTGNLAQTTSSIYFLGFSFGILILGRISDSAGRRPIIFGGLILYLISSIACSFASEIETLLLFRFLQAFGASVGSVITQAMARDSFEGKKLAGVFVSISICLSFIPSLGSMLGGYIVEYLGWEYNFRFLGIVAFFLISISLLYLPETNKDIGIEASERGYFSVLKQMASDKMVLTYALIIGAFNGMMFGFYLEAPFIFIDYFQFHPSEYGKMSIFITLAYFIGGSFSKYLVARIDNKRVIVTGLTISLIACTILFLGTLLLNKESGKTLAISLIFLPIMLQIIGHTFSIPVILRFALENYDDVRGTAGSIFGGVYYSVVALINFTLSRLHGEYILPFAALFLMLSIISFMSFKAIEDEVGR